MCKDLYKDVLHSSVEDKFLFFIYDLADKVKRYLNKYSRAVERGRLKSDILFYQDDLKYFNKIENILKDLNNINHSYEDKYNKELVRMFEDDIKDFSSAYYRFLGKINFMLLFDSDDEDLD